MGLVRLSIDYENASKTWWASGGQELWDSVTEEFDASSVVVDEAIAGSWMAQAEQVPGWADGPDFAPHPIRSTAVADDEDPEF